MNKKDLAIMAMAFNRPQPRTEYVTREVHEHRAPTDDSIRLAKEYEEKIWASVKNRVLEDIKEIDAQVIYCQRDHASNDKCLLISINGRNVDIRLPDSYRESKQEIIERTIKIIAEEIAKQLFQRGLGA